MTSKFLKTHKPWASEDIIKNVKRQPTECEKVFADQVSSKVPIYRLPKLSLQLNNEKTNAQCFKWANNLDRHFFEEDIQMANSTRKDAQHH